METDKKTLQNNPMLAYLGIQFRNGLRSIRESKIKTILALCFLLVAVACHFCVTTPTTDRLTHLLQLSTPFQNVDFRRNGMSFFTGQHTGVIQPYTPHHLPD